MALVSQTLKIHMALVSDPHASTLSGLLVLLTLLPDALLHLLAPVGRVHPPRAFFADHNTADVVSTLPGFRAGISPLEPDDGLGVKIVDQHLLYLERTSP